MQEEDINKLTALRQSILDSIVPLMDSDSLQPMDRFRLLSRLAQAQGRPELYEKAFAAASKLDGDQKLESYMSLLDDVDYEIDSAVGTAPTTTAAPASAPAVTEQPANQAPLEDDVHRDQQPTPMS